jgi:hypothetical protein
MKSTNDESLCLHQIDSYWWMDGRCFLLLAEYLKQYYPEANGLNDISGDQILFVAINSCTLFANRKLFTIKKIAEKALLLTFTHPGTFKQDAGKNMIFELFYEKEDRAEASQVSFFV